MEQGEFNNLIIKSQQGDKEALGILVEKNMGLVGMVARKMNLENRVDDYEGAIAEGIIGLITAIKQFDISKGFTLSTYACKHIHGNLSNYVICGHGSRKPIRMTKKYYFLMYDINQFIEDFQKGNGIDPTVEQISKAINATMKDVNDALLINKEIYSLEAKVIGNDDSSTMLGELILDKRCLNEDSIVNRLILSECIKELKEKEQKVIRMKYYEDLRNVDIAKKIGLTEAGVKFLEKRVLEKLKKMIGSDCYETSLDVKKRA